MLFPSRTAKARPGQDHTIRVVAARLAGAASDRAVLAAAGEIAAAFGAHVDAIHIPALPPSVAALMGEPEASYPGFGASDDATNAEHAKTAREGFDAWRMIRGWPVGTAEGNGPSVGYHIVDGDEPDTLAACIRLADLAVMARPGVAALEKALMTSGRPVLLVPDGWSGTLLAGGAVIAWNASAQAARALAGALPLLRAMKGKAAVFTAAERNRPAAAQDAAGYLQWHGIQTEIPSPPPGDAGAGLLRVAREEAAGFIVSGAYAHGRLRQTLFGGVTTHLIQEAELPVLFAG